MLRIVNLPRHGARFGVRVIACGNRVEGRYTGVYITIHLTAVVLKLTFNFLSQQHQKILLTLLPTSKCPSSQSTKVPRRVKLSRAETERPDLKDDQVLVKVTASGLCGTDEHYKGVDMALGHEGAGIVEQTGPNVKELKKGDRVGWGYSHDSCGQCEQCLTGRETYCPKREMYGQANLDQGSFASHAVWREAFLFRIPDALSDAEAAPLMCGGATVFNALYSYGIKSTDRVGVMGVGGLGHLAIQYASKMGCDVVVFSGSDSKKEEAQKLGANEFIAMKDKKELNIGRPLNALLVTTSANPGKPSSAHVEIASD